MTPQSNTETYQRDGRKRRGDSFMAAFNLAYFTFWAAGFVIMEANFASHPTLKGGIAPLLYVIVIIWAANDFARSSGTPSHLKTERMEG